MKKLILSMVIMLGIVSPTIGQAATLQEVDTVNPINQDSTIMPRGLFYYIFPSVPPKKFNGMSRIYYEYKANKGYYIGYYQ